MFFYETAQDNAGYESSILQSLPFLIWSQHAYVQAQCYDRLDSNLCMHVLNQTSLTVATGLALSWYLDVQAEQRTRADHHDHRLTKPSIYSFFLNKMPHLVQLHHTNRLHFIALGAKAFDVITQPFNPAHHRCMGYVR
jgi:hypothetical protein